MANSQSLRRIGLEFENRLIVAGIIFLCGLGMAFATVRYYMDNGTPHGTQLVIVDGYFAIGCMLILGGVYLYIRGRRRFYRGLGSP